MSKGFESSDGGLRETLIAERCADVNDIASHTELLSLSLNMQRRADEQVLRKRRVQAEIRRRHEGYDKTSPHLPHGLGLSDDGEIILTVCVGVDGDDDCDEVLPLARIKDHCVRCTSCQSMVEKRNKQFGGVGHG